MVSLMATRTMDGKFIWNIGNCFRYLLSFVLVPVKITDGLTMTKTQAIKAVENLSNRYEKLSDREVKEYCKLKKYEEIGTIEECRKAIEEIKHKSNSKKGSCSRCFEDLETWYQFCPTCGKIINKDDWRDL